MNHVIVRDIWLAFLAAAAVRAHRSYLGRGLNIDVDGSEVGWIDGGPPPFHEAALAAGAANPTLDTVQELSPVSSGQVKQR